MNDKIKEILDELNWYIKQPNNQDINGEYEPPMELSQEEAKDIYNCITNLQQENDNLTTSLNKKIEEGINLQQEIERLKEQYDLVCKISEERKNKWLSLNDENEDLFHIAKDYKSRIEKAIEYNKEIIDNYLKEDNCEYCDGRYATAKHNLNILQNGSEKDDC